MDSWIPILISAQSSGSAASSASAAAAAAPVTANRYIMLAGKDFSIESVFFSGLLKLL